MSVFIDTNVFIYALTATPYSAPCQRLLVAIANDGFDATTSVVVAEEAWHIERRAPLGIPSGSILTMLGLFGRVLDCSIDIVEEAMRMPSLPDQLGSADRIHLATCQAHGIDTIISADAGFDGVDWLHRVDPDVSGVDRLLRSIS